MAARECDVVQKGEATFNTISLIRTIVPLSSTSSCRVFLLPIVINMKCLLTFSDYSEYSFDFDKTLANIAVLFRYLSHVPVIT